MNINQAVKEVVKMHQQVGLDQPEAVEDLLLGSYESITKLNQAIFKKDDEEINKRIASTLIGVLLLADKLGVENLEKSLTDRISEIKDKNK